MIVSFVIFMVLFLGGIYLMGISFELPEMQAVVFCVGMAAVTLAMAWMMREGKTGATRRSKSWERTDA